MRSPVVIIGIGELGGVFARGFLRAGHPVYPITRQMDMAREAADLPEPELVLVAVAEQELHRALERVPAAWRDRMGLIQNELLPRDWRYHELPTPTVIVAWFEKKKGQDTKVLIPSPVYGPAARTVSEALGSIGVPTRALDTPEDLLYELVLKNVYILTTNIAGMVTGGTVAELKAERGKLAGEVAREVIEVQEWLTGQRLPAERLIADMYGVFDADPEHKCTGRSAPARISRAIEYANLAGLDVSTIREIGTRLSA
ncbi:MAG: hypothetical protein GWO02_21560 [Gammaproteobacteria bacterium]|nr:hypothetical protein [Gammaproteobacteria bacterium]